MVFFFVGSPSPSKGLEPSAPGMVPSSMTVTHSDAMLVSSLPIKNDARLYNESPDSADERLRKSEPAISGSKTTGTSQVLILRAPRRLKTPCAAFSPTLLRDSSRAHVPSA